MVAVTALAVSVPMTGARGQGHDEVYGVWEHPENGNHIEFLACGEGLCAIIRRISDAQRHDDRNPDVALRRRPILGLRLVDAAQRMAGGAWQGRLYNRMDGRTYHGRFAVKPGDRLAMTACAANAVCRTVVWRRVEMPERGP